MRVIVCILVLVTLAIPPAFAQGQSALAGQIDLVRLVDLAAERLGLRIEYDPARLGGRVAVRGGDALSDEALWSTTNRALAARGLTTLRPPGDDAIVVVLITEAGSLARHDSFEELLSSSAIGRPGYASVLYHAAHADPARLIEAIRPHLSRTGSTVAQIGQGRAILVSDLTPRLEQVHHLLAASDTPPERAAASLFAPRHADPAALAAIATQTRDRARGLGLEAPGGDILVLPGQRELAVLCAASDLPLWQAILTTFDREPALETIVYAPGPYPLAEVASLIEESLGVRVPTGVAQPAPGWSLVRDSLTNVLIITGTPAQHRAVRDVLDRLEAAPPGQRRTTRTFQVRHRAAEEVAGVLRGLMGPDLDVPSAALPDGGIGGIAQPRSGAESMAGSHEHALPPPPTGSQPRLALATDGATNTLIAVGEPRALAQAEELLRMIDVRQSQVMLEVLLVSLSDSQTRNLGVEIAGLISSGDLRIRLSSLFGLSTIAGGLPGGGFGGPGGRATVLSPDEFAIVVRALETVNRGRSLSAPRVLIGNGQQASLNSTLGQPVTSVNASDTVATTTFAGFSDAGTQVNIRPRIAAGDHLLLEYSITLSAFVGESPAPGIPPPRQQNQLQSVVTIPDGSTVVVGGIELTTEADAEGRVPVLGSIPLVREVFRNRSTSRNRQRFFVFIRAEIDRGRSFDALRHASDLAADEAGLEDGWPTVSPRMIR